MGIAGFAVAALCPSRHPLRKLSRLEFAATYFHPARFALLRRAIAGWRPDLLVPGDDAAVALLHDLHRRSVRSGTDEARRTAALIEASLGGFAEPEPVRNRSALVGLAASLGIAVPRTCVVEDEAVLRARAGRGAAPLVLKSDGTSGGLGVRIVAGRDTALEALHSLRAAGLGGGPVARRAVRRPASPVPAPALRAPCRRRAGPRGRATGEPCGRLLAG